MTTGVEMLTSELLGELDSVMRRAGAPVEAILAPGLGPKVLDQRTNAALGLELTTELHRLWGWHNGGLGLDGPHRGLIGWFVHLMDVDAALDWSRFWIGLDEETPDTPAWWREGFVAFAKIANYTAAADVSGGYDAPSPVWLLDTWDIEPPTAPVFDSVGDFLRWCIGCFQGGGWFWDPERFFIGRDEERLTPGQRDIHGRPNWPDRPSPF